MTPSARTIALAVAAWLAGSGAFAQAPAEPAPKPPAGSDVPAAETGRDRIIQVRVEGARRVEPEAIRRALRQKVGDVFRPDLTREDIKALWALGFFSDVRLLVQRLPKGIVYLVQVEERPALHEVKLSGNEEISSEDFKDTLDIKPGSILDLEAIRKDEKKIQDKYLEKGYFLAEITHRLDPVPKTGEVDLVFVIREHSKVLVKEINLLGVKEVPLDELKGAMATKEGSFLSFVTNEGIYREEMFQRDLLVLQSVYYDHGFINVNVGKPSLSLSADKKYIFITIHVEEGDQYKIGKLDLSGDLLFPKEQLKREMTSREGEVFNRSKLGADILHVQDRYHDEGYAYANINPLTQVHPEEKVIDLTFDVQKGKQVYIERIEISGNTKTRDNVIRREMRVYEGELFSGSGLRRSKERVTALGFFESVEVSHRPGGADNQVIVTVDVKEKATGTFQLGFGFSNVESFILTGQVSQNNFIGWGTTVSASVQWSGLRNLIQLSLYDPYFLDTNFIFALDAYRTEAQYPDFIRQATGGTLNVGYQFVEDLMANVGYTNEYVVVEPGVDFTSQILLADRFRSGTTSEVRASITWDKRDNRLYPTSGFLHFAQVEAAPSWLGGTFEFMRYTAYSRFYQPLPLGLVFKTNVTFGYMQQLNPKSPLPISEFYHLGGINTIRGYLLRSISPTATVAMNDRPDAPTSQFTQPFHVGGNKQLILNIELEFPIFEKAGVRGVVFYDAGNAYSPDEYFFQDKQNRSLPLGVYHAVGVGFRWFSPIGPLRFEWGFPLTRRPEDQPYQFEFTIGNSF